MISADLLGRVETTARVVAHNGLHEKERFGGIPVILLVGDDYQLPPVEIGASGIFSNDVLKEKTIKMGMTHDGLEIFKKLGENYIKLKTSKRVLKGQELLTRCLEGVRGDTDRGISQKDIQQLMNFHLNSTHWSHSQKE